jgi:hypothetical protein
MHIGPTQTQAYAGRSGFPGVVLGGITVSALLRQTRGGCHRCSRLPREPSLVCVPSPAPLRLRFQVTPALVGGCPVNAVISSRQPTALVACTRSTRLHAQLWPPLRCLSRSLCAVLCPIRCYEQRAPVRGCTTQLGLHSFLVTHNVRVPRSGSSTRLPAAIVRRRSALAASAHCDLRRAPLPRAAANAIGARRPATIRAAARAIS